MEKLSLDLPAMFADHHVVEVRHILLEMAGVKDVYASSGFQVVEVDYDPSELKAEEIEAALDEAGYLGELFTPAETGEAAYGSGGETFFRHSAAYEQTGKTVGFTQRVEYSGRPLWHCPGMGPVQGMDEEE